MRSEMSKIGYTTRQNIRRAQSVWQSIRQRQRTRRRLARTLKNKTSQKDHKPEIHASS